MKIEEIRAKINVGEYRFSDHAVKRMIKRSIDRDEIENAILFGEIIEEYPEDKYSPSCLVYRQSKVGLHLHIQLSLPPEVVIITAYDPDEDEWIDYRVRREKS
jgi:hypothetical protein